MIAILEPEAARCATREHETTALDELGLAIQHGHDVRPWPGIAQALWFSIGFSSEEQPPYPSTSYFLIEHTTGQLQVVRLSGLTCNPERMIPSFAKWGVTTESEVMLEKQLCSGWLLPPAFCVDELSDSPIAPTPAFLRNMIREELAALLGGKSQPVPLRTTLERLLEMPTVSFDEKFGNKSIQRHVRPLTTDKSLLPLPSIAKEILVNAEAFRIRLSADILALFEKYVGWLDKADSTHNYNTLVGWTGCRRRNRIQAMAAIPWLFHEFGLRTGDGEFFHTPPSNVPALSADSINAIDTGRPIMRQLAQHYDVQPHTIRNACRLLKIHYLRPESIPAFLWLLDGMKADHQPRDPAGLHALLPALHWICNWKLDVDRAFLGKIAVELFNDGVQGATRLFHRWCPSHNAANPYNDLQDFISSHAEQCGYPIQPEEIFGKLFKEWVCDNGLRSIFAASDQWHMEWWIRDQACDDLTWISLFNAPIAVGSLIAYELSNTAMLLEEGKAMRHCVASYAPLCTEGNDFIFSLRTPDGIRHSTVHVWKQNVQHFRIREHRSFANKEPDQPSCVAARILVRHLSSTACLSGVQPERIQC